MFRIESWRRFWEAKLGFINRLTLLSLACASRMGIRVWIKTTMDAENAEAGQVIHTTEIGKFGIAFYASREVFELEPDGESIRLSRVQRVWPFKSRRMPEDFGSGRVKADARGATYDWLWYDRRMTQTTEKDGQGLQLQQVSDWSSAHVFLTRT